MPTSPPATLPLWSRLRLRLLQLDDAMFEHARPSQPTLVAISLIGSLCMLLYYPIWKYALPQPYESLPLRIAGCVVLLPLSMQRWWPRHLRALLPAYWHATVTFVLPFFAGYMLLRNGGSTAWLLIHLASIYLTMMMFDVAGFLAIFAVGSTLAWLAWLLGPHLPMPAERMLLYLPLLAMAVALGPLASLSQKHADQTRIQALQWQVALDPDGARPREAQAMVQRGIIKVGTRGDIVRYRMDLLPEIAGKLDGLGDARIHALVTAIAYRLDPEAATKRSERAASDRRVAVRPAAGRTLVAQVFGPRRPICDGANAPIWTTRRAARPRRCPPRRL